MNVLAANGSQSYRNAAKAGSPEFKPVKYRLREYGPANPSDSCSMSKGGALDSSFKWREYAKDHCETHKCDIITELSNGRCHAPLDTSPPAPRRGAAMNWSELGFGIGWVGWRWGRLRLVRRGYNMMLLEMLEMIWGKEMIEVRD